MAISFYFISTGTEQFGSAANVCVCIRQFSALDICRVMAIMNEDFLVSPEPNRENSGRVPRFCLDCFTSNSFQFIVLR